jgi:oxygen-dependent protoporphyrinogen oxidase
VVIVGGGISGLSAAYYLSRAGIRSTLIEQRPRLGGVIQTELIQGCLLEAGPDSFLSAKPWALDLIRELGLSGEVIGSNDHLRVTYVWKGGRLIPLPDGLMLMVPTRIRPMMTTRLLGWGTKIRMGLEYFRRPASGAVDRSVGEFVRERYGTEAVDYLAEPLLAGVYGGDPWQLSVSSVLGRFVELDQKYGSLARGVLAERRLAAKKKAGDSLPLFQTLRGGLESLVDSLRRAAGDLLHVVEGKAEQLGQLGRGLRVMVNQGLIEADHVVLACQAFAAAELVRPLDGKLAELLASIPYNSSVTVALVYDRAGFKHKLDGFGFLVPKRERRRVVACTWVGTKFHHRVAEDRVVLRCFLGGGDEAVVEESDASLGAMVREELREMMGVTEEPLSIQVARWPRSMAQYTVGHQEKVARIESRVRDIPGLYLAGNAYAGIGIPDCIHSGKLAAERIVAASG